MRLYALYNLLSTLVPSTIAEVQLMQAVVAHLVAVEQTSAGEDSELDCIDHLMVAIHDGLEKICGRSPLRRFKAGQSTTAVMRCAIDARDRKTFSEATATLKQLGRHYE